MNYPAQRNNPTNSPKSPGIDEPVRVLKYDETFAVFDSWGDIRNSGADGEGIYHYGTRYISDLRLELNGVRPLLLGSTVRDDNALLNADLTNNDVFRGEQLVLEKDSVHIHRRVFLFDNTCHMRLVLRNFARERVRLAMTLFFGADFVDIFEVRGMSRRRRGRSKNPKCGDESVTFEYEGLDGMTYRSMVEFDPPPAKLTTDRAEFSIELESNEVSTYAVTLTCNPRASDRRKGFDADFEQAVRELEAARSQDTHVSTSNVRFNDWLNRSSSDLHLMVTRTSLGPYPYAGVPWFSAPFGRDGIISALMYLWVNPNLASGVLRYLADRQATEVNTEKDSEPGKILHETRPGEMAALGEIPFAEYYGTVDATPLFIVLADAYYQRTADEALIRELWPNIEQALHWIDEYGDHDGDGFVEYSQKSRVGIKSQGWKDSNDVVFHADGSLAESPIALCEVQAYVYAAKSGAARLAEVLGAGDAADKLRAQAEHLKARFNDAFWDDELGTYALALDRNKEKCRVRTSNAGHCLFGQIALPDRARSVVRELMSGGGYSGWGIRTVAEGEARYNPMSYHNGSVWPHDNALIAYGMSRYHCSDEVSRLFDSWYDLSGGIDLSRLPELICGFERRPGAVPTLYPSACAPQAWAAASVFMLLQASLGMQIDAPNRCVSFVQPGLPRCLKQVSIRNLCVGHGRIDLSFESHEHGVSIKILERDGDVKVEISK